MVEGVERAASLDLELEAVVGSRARTPTVTRLVGSFQDT
jgi:hypothetical protein